MKRYSIKKTDIKYGPLMDAVEVHNHAESILVLLAQVSPHEADDMDMLEAAIELVKDLKMPV